MQASGVDDGNITVTVHDECGVVGAVEIDWADDGMGRKVYQLGVNIGGVAIEVKVPSSQEMEDGRATRQWKVSGSESRRMSQYCNVTD